MRIILSILMIVAAIAGFVVFIIPNYQAVSALKAQAADYEAVLENARKLETERNALVQKYNAFNPNALEALNKLLPASPQSVNLILELNAVASQYGMVLQNVKVDDTTAIGNGSTASRTGAAANSEIGTLSIQFSVKGTYEGFTNFMKTIEKSLRIVNVDKVTFTANDPKTSIYQYTVGVNTYWLK